LYIVLHYITVSYIIVPHNITVFYITASYMTCMVAGINICTAIISRFYFLQKF